MCANARCSLALFLAVWHEPAKVHGVDVCHGLIKLSLLYWQRGVGAGKGVPRICGRCHGGGSDSLGLHVAVASFAMATNAPLLGKEKKGHSKASIFYGADEYLEELRLPP